MADYETNTKREGVVPGAAGVSSSADTSKSDQAKETLKQNTGQVREDAREAVDNARHQVESVLSEQKDAAAGQVAGIAKALHKTAEQLNAQDQGPAAVYVDRAAESLDRLCSNLRERDIGALSHELQDFAKRQPGVFLGGAVAAGFLVARFLKSSPHRDTADYQASSFRQSGATAGSPGVRSTTRT